jgi:hypothetical protein
VMYKFASDVVWSGVLWFVSKLSGFWLKLGVDSLVICDWCEVFGRCLFSLNCSRFLPLCIN